MNNKFFKLGALLVVLLLMATVSTFAQLSTVYVDVSNGSDTYTGANQTNAVAGTGPVQTINKGLTLLANNGTLVIMAGTYQGSDGANTAININSTTYTNITTGLTIQMLTLNSNTMVEIAGTSAFTFNIPNGTLTFAAPAGEYMSFTTATTFNVTAGTVNIPASTMVRLVTGSTIAMTGTAAFSTTAPQKGTNISVSYSGAGSFSAGPESNYGSYGTGSIYINKSGGTVTFPNAITKVAQIQLANAGSAVFSSNVTVTEVGSILNNSTGSLTFNGSVNLGMKGTTVAFTTLTSVTNNSTGSMTFNGPVTWTVTGTDAGAGGTLDFAAANIGAVENQSTGTITFANVITLIPDDAGSFPWSVNLNAVNANSGGTITFNSFSETTGAVNSTDVFFGLVNAGTVNFTASTTLNGPIANTGTIALGGFNLTLTTATAHTMAGSITGTGSTLLFPVNVTINGTAGVLPNISIPSGKTLTFSGTTTVGSMTIVGNLALAAGSTLTVKGDFNRTSGTFTAGATSTLKFQGTTAQAFNAGPNFTVVNLTFANTGGLTTVGSSIRATGTVTINTSVAVAFNTLNVILKSAAAMMINNGSYTASGGGGVIAGGVNTITDFYTGNGIALQGNGTYSYITIDVGAGNTVTVNNGTDNVLFSGVLTLRSGNVSVGGNAVNFGPSGSTASIISYPNAAGTSGHIVTTGAGTFNANNLGLSQVAVDYDLTYTGALAGAATVAAGTSEFDAAHVKNLTVSTTAFGLGLTSAGDVTIKGNLTLAGTDTWFQLDGGTPFNVEVKGNLNVATGTVLHGGSAAKIIKLSGNGMTHSVAGQIDALSLLRETGSGATMSGLQTAGDMAYVSSLEFEPTADNSTFSASGLVTVAGNVKVQNTSAKAGANFTLSMNATDATLTGNVTVGNGTYTPTAAITVAGSTTSSFTGNVTLTNGTLTLTRGGVDTTVTGNFTLTKGTFNLGSDLYIVGTVAQNDVVVNMGAYYLTMNGANYDMSGGSGSGAINATTGYLGFVTTGVTFTPYSTTTSVPNLWVGAGFTLAGPLTVSNALVHTTGTIALGANDLTMAGNLFNEVATTYTSGGGVLNLTGTALSWKSSGNVTVPNLTINAPSGTVTFASTSSTSARTWTVSTAFIQTAGTVALGSQKLVFSGASTFSRTASNPWTMSSSGLVTFSTSGTIDFGTSFAVDNIEFTASATPALGTDGKTKPFTVNKKLTLTGGTLTTDAGRMTLADGILITRNNNAAVLSSIPTFSGASSNTYATLGTITTGKELQSAVTNFTASVAVTLAKSVQVNTYLTAAAMITAGSFTLTTAANATFELQDVGTNLLDKALNKLGALNLVYNFATAKSTSTMELGSVNSSGSLNGYYSGTVGNVTIKGAGSLNLGAHILIGGTLTFATAGTSSAPVQGGYLDLEPVATAYKVQVQGDVVQTGTLPGFFISTGGVSTVSFTGAANTALTLSIAQAVPANIKIYISKTNASNVVSLSGGDLDFSTNSQMPYFVNGILATSGTSSVILKQGVSANQPTQGFDITGMVSPNQSGVNGNVKKLVDVFTGLGGGVNEPSTRNSRVVFPTAGSASNPYYRPLSIYFKTLPSANLNLTVSHTDTKAGGQNGFPIVLPNKTITNYPNFFWFVKSDLALAPSFKYDMDAQAQGYTDYALDGIQNIRFVRRDSGNVNNQWILQGADANYDNSTIAANWPVVKVIDAQGGVTTQGSIFTYSQNNKAPAYTSAPANVTKNEGDTLNVTFTATDPDFGDVVTMTSTGTLPAGATFTPTNGNPASGILKWVIGYDVASAASPTTTQTFTVHSVDTYGALAKDTTITVTVNNVNRAPVFNPRTLASTITDKDTLKVTLAATDADANTVTYSFMSVTPVTANAPAVTGTQLTWAPVFAEAGSTYAIKVLANDGFGGTDTLTVNATVGRSRARGDVDGNGTVQAADATPVLQYVAGLPTGSIDFTNASVKYAADASANGTISAYDAAQILQAANGLITLPTNADVALGKTNTVAATGSLAWAAPQATKDEGVVKMALKLADAANVYSAQLSSKVDANLMTVDGVTATLPDGWQMMWNVVDNNELRIVMAGTTPLSSGDIGSVMIRLKNKESRLSLSTDAMLNENFQSLGAVEIAAVPTVFALEQNYPNPFNPSTTIRYQIPQDANVSLIIYNVQGQKIRTMVAKEQKAGYYNAVWDGRNEAGETVSSGLYLYRVQAGSFVAVHKMMLIK